MIYNVDLKCELEADSKKDALYKLEYHIETFIDDEFIENITVKKCYCKRFQIMELPIGYSSGNYYKVYDTFNKMKPVEFKYENDALIICEQLNELYEKE